MTIKLDLGQLNNIIVCIKINRIEKNNIFMDKKVYYGEYSLKHWVEMLLKKDLELPPYQRDFVWSEEQVKGLINGLKEDFFIPPVTIGVCKIAGKNHNLILDGQQRLSSILLAYLGVYPKKEAFLRDDSLILADGAAEEDIDEPDVEYINWSLRIFADNGPIEEDVRNTINSTQYNLINFQVNNDFFENKYLPFSFIIPNVDDEAEQHEFYSSVFRNINILGTALNPIESRQSLYFLKTELKDFFDPDCCKNFKIALVGKNQAYDFVRTMAILSQYKKDGRFNRLAQGYKSKMEKYYEEYIYAVVKDKNDGMFVQFSTIFNNKNYSPRIEALKEALHELNYDQLQFTSIIDADIYMFGLVYNTVIEGNHIDFDHKDRLMNTLKNKIISIKRIETHKNSPSLLKHMRYRVEQSITIFNRYLCQTSL